MSNDTLLNGRYRLVAQQGSGGMAVVYKAIDEALGRTVAVKILRPSLTSDPQFLVKFRNEARSIANLAHPNIVTVYDVGNDGPTQYIVMEYVDGQDLKKIIRDQGALQFDRALNVAIQICAGIGFTHRAGRVHADIKPQNILMTSDDTVKITDFGIAQALTDTQPGERQTVVWGSPHYFAPEQARGEKPSPASDVYSVGIVMFEMFTGRLPYTGTSQQELALAHIRDDVPLITDVNPNLPESMARIVRKVMSKEPSARYRMADQLGQVLIGYKDKGRNVAAGQNFVSVAPPPASPPPSAAPQMPPPPPARSGPMPPHYTGSQSVQNRSGGQSGQQSQPGQQSQYSPPRFSGASQQQSQPSQPQPSGRSQVPPPPSQPLMPNTAYGSPPPSQQGQFSSATPLPYTAQGAPAADSGSYAPPSEPLQREYEQYDASSVSSGMDVVTIVLAVLAFFAVACLIPLYIAVFQARFAG